MEESTSTGHYKAHLDLGGRCSCLIKEREAERESESERERVRERERENERERLSYTHSQRLSRPLLLIYCISLGGRCGENALAADGGNQRPFWPTSRLCGAQVEAATGEQRGPPEAR